MSGGIFAVFNSDLRFYRIRHMHMWVAILESGRSHSIDPSRRRLAISLASLCARRMVMGNSSGVSSVAYPNIIP
jgi:hypothetical protein